MDRLYKFILISLIFLLLFIKSNGQVYPVRVIPQLIPPYSPYLSEYSQPVVDHIKVTIMLADLSEFNRKVRLSVSIQGQGVSVRSKDITALPPVILDGGTPVTLGADELSPYFRPENLLCQGVIQTNKGAMLPEGVYQFSFQVYDYQTNRLLSSKSSAMAWIVLSEPPLLNLPINGQNIILRDPQNIVFQWTPRHMSSPNSAFSVEYKFSLVEIWDTHVDPQTAFLSSPPLYQTTTYATTLLYGIEQPALMPGKNYAYRVQARAKNGLEEFDLFKNKGYSEIHHFNCAKECAVPQGLQATVGDYAVEIQWLMGMESNTCTLAWKRKGIDDTCWSEATTIRNSYSLFELEAGTTYQYRIRGNCPWGEGDWSPTLEFTTRREDEIMSNIQCGLHPDPVNIISQESLPKLLRGDVVMAGDVPVHILESKGGNGLFSGRGYIALPLLNSVKIAVKFKQIKINKDLQLVDGFIETQYDPTCSNIVDVDEIVDLVSDVVDVVGDGGDGEEMDYNEVVIEGEVEDVQVDEMGNIIITITDSETRIISPKDSEENVPPTRITDGAGHEYTVVAGVVTEGGGSGVSGKNGRRLDLSRAEITFHNTSESHYGFDIYNKQEYPNLMLEYEVMEADSGTVVVPWKALATGEMDPVDVVVNNRDTSLHMDKLFFETPQGVRYAAQPSTEDNKLRLNLAGKGGTFHEEIYSLYPQGDENVSLAKLNVISYDKERVKVVLVPVNKNHYDGDINQLREYLNRIYGQAVVEWDVEIGEESISVEYDNLEVGTSILSGYNSDLRKVIRAFKNSDYRRDSKTCYLFMVDKCKDKISGYMPRAGQYGFIFTDGSHRGGIERTIAHELGHGQFHLQHTFKEYNLPRSSTHNLMDYADGYQFIKPQWDNIHDPTLVMGIFQDVEEGEMKSQKEKLHDLLQRIRCAYASNRRRIYIPFLTNKYDVFSNVEIDDVNYPRIRLEWNEENTEYIDLKDGLRSPVNTFLMAIKKKALKYNFGPISLLIPESNKDHFEHFILNFDFDKEYSKLSNFVKKKENNEALNCLLNNSYCVYERLNSVERIALIKALAEKFILKEEYEDVVINLLRSANNTYGDEYGKKSLLNQIFHAKIKHTVFSELCNKQPKTIYEYFDDNIGNVGGKDNYDLFIKELAKVFFATYTNELANIKDEYLYFCWSRRGVDPLHIINGYIDISNLYEHGYYEQKVSSKTLGFDDIVLVNYERDFSFLKSDDSRYALMPAFVLKYLIDNEVTKLNVEFINEIMIMVSFTKALSGLSLLKKASKMEKAKIGWELFKSTLELVLSNDDIKEKIINIGENGETFISAWEYFQKIDALSNAVDITQLFNSESRYMFISLTDSWNVLNKNPNINKYLEGSNLSVVQITEIINNLKLIFNDEGIVY